VDTVYDVLGLALAANATPNAWLMHPSTFIAARKLKDLQDRYLLQPDPQAANLYVLVGVPVFTTTFMPTDRVVLLDARQVAVARDLDTTVAVLTERYADYDQVGIRVTARMDIAPLNPAAVVDLTLAG
jgi:HK97 family phage major capsid protein